MPIGPALAALLAVLAAPTLATDKAALRHKYAQPPQVLQSIDVRR
jgi:hypothetical protein